MKTAAGRQRHELPRYSALKRGGNRVERFNLVWTQLHGYAALYLASAFSAQRINVPRLKYSLRPTRRHFNSPLASKPLICQ